MSEVAAVIEGDSAADLLRTEALLDALYGTLEAEIQAIARCDFEAITQIGCDKKQFLIQLEDAAGPSLTLQSGNELEERNEGREHEAIRRRVSYAAVRVRAMMRANHALMGEAIGAISAKLGTDTRAQSYDKRARTVGQTRRPSSKSI